ncbi:hypothetical protein [Azospirillum sp. BE72]|uniref:hypothetical protein n=1 Tax=Azospirillum sp. BE72 TaxID=2817776 RepID=UPI002860BDCB|nr:hypothetical protein [Azospirillum sp. BE72]MDR6775589.1 hypothetical protein [Azospirillum sp. BE72]
MLRRTFLSLCGAAAASSAVRPAFGQPLPRLDLEQLRAEGDLGFRAATRALAGQRVVAAGYLIPHSKAGAGYHVLASSPLVSCPHCFPDLPLPPDAIVMYLREDAALPTGAVVEVEGVLDLGAKRDTWTGLVSVARLLDGSLYLS